MNPLRLNPEQWTVLLLLGRDPLLNLPELRRRSSATDEDLLDLSDLGYIVHDIGRGKPLDREGLRLLSTWYIRITPDGRVANKLLDPFRRVIVHLAYNTSGLPAAKCASDAVASMDDLNALSAAGLIAAHHPSHREPMPLAALPSHLRATAQVTLTSRGRSYR
ncbi:hypothetical protein ABT297_10995 [Dactylosporangium sp. NPDC000555]|uniref:hypothetical protein n=1 Tax=Dactylosporangium sp. NPDC000555 TaxID=3154260 RepID=UPI003334109F